MGVLILEDEGGNLEEILRLWIQIKGHPMPSFTYLSDTDAQELSLPHLTARAPALKNANPNFTIDAKARTCTVNGHPIKLTEREFKLLYTLHWHQGKLVSHQRLHAVLYAGETFLESDKNSLAIHVCNIRKKLAVANPRINYIETVRGLGFRFCVS